MARKFKEVVLKPFSAYGHDYARGEVFRMVSITERDAEFLNSRKDDFGFEYVEVIEPIKPLPPKVELKEEEDEEIKSEQETMEAEKPKRGFPKKK